MAEERGQFLIDRVRTDHASGRQLEPFLVVKAATRERPSGMRPS